MKNLNKQLITILENFIPKGMNIAGFLMDTLFIGKDAAYRRIRGEVPFTLDELALIYNATDISFDELFGKNKPSQVNLSFSYNPKDDVFDQLTKIFMQRVSNLEKINNSEEAEVSIVAHILPYFLYCSHENLFKFELIKWQLQVKNIKTFTPISQFSMPEKLITVKDKYEKTVMNGHFNTQFIFNKNMFIYFAKNVHYFYKLKAIDYQELCLLKDDLFAIMDELEMLGEYGETPKYKHDNKIYISNIELDNSYYLYESKAGLMSEYNVYLFNSFYTENPLICDIQKKWIDSCKRFSTYITKSGELIRHEFFAEQREQVSHILNVE